MIVSDSRPRLLDTTLRWLTSLSAQQRLVTARRIHRDLNQRIPACQVDL